MQASGNTSISKPGERKTVAGATNSESKAESKPALTKPQAISKSTVVVGKVVMVIINNIKHPTKNDRIIWTEGSNHSADRIFAVCG